MIKSYLLILCAIVSFAGFAQVGPITGTFTVCETYGTQLLCTPPSGTWSSSNPLIASVSLTGFVTGVSAGVATITYNDGSMGFAVASFTVNPLPATILCPTAGCNVCLGSTITVADATPGGVWSTQLPGIASVVPLTGVVTGVSLGTTQLFYTLPTGCFVGSLITVFPNPGPITGVTTVCAGLTTTLNCTPPPPYTGVWSSSPLTVATVNPVSGVVTGISAGVASVTFMLSTGCYSITNVTVNPTPGPISCPSTSGCKVCVGNTLALTCPPPGGVWSSSNPAVGSIDPSTGVVTGISPGLITITYTLGGCTATANVIVNANPGPITGITSLCAGSNTTLSCSPPFGSWSSSNPTVATVGAGTGLVMGLTAGVTTITYTLSSGCYSVINFTVNPTPGPISCPSVSGCSVCVGNTLLLTDASPGGTWMCTSPLIATINAVTGVLTAVSPGIANIVYTLPGGCSVTISIIVNPNPGPITGITTICAGNNTTLSCTPPSGTWSSSNIAVATVNPGTGLVNGVTAGVATITYMLGTGCYSVTNVTVNPTPVISIPSVGYHVCVGNQITILATPGGGTWTCTPPAVATIGAISGILTGLAPGVATVVYTLPGGCSANTTVTVNPDPGPITGTTVVCVGSTTTLSCLPGAGVWSSSPLTVATVNPLSGVVGGISAGTATITYTLSTGCYVTTVVTVNPLPTITGTLYTCVGSTTVLTGLPFSGIWSSGNPIVATVGAGSGIVTGITPGTTPVTYVLPTGCSYTVIVTVTPTPGPIYCPSLGCQVCLGNSVLVTDPLPGGVWSSSNIGIATVGSNTGIVTGVSVGTSYITYTLGGCFVTTLFTVNPVPAPFNVTGGGSYCAGGTGVLIGLSGSQIGVNYQLFCSGGPVGLPVAGTGSAISFGLQTTPCTYTVVGSNAFGCLTSMTGNAVVTVNPVPQPITCPISGCQVCAGNSIQVTDPTVGGMWSGSNPVIGTIGAGTGIVYGVSQGIFFVTYTLTGGCYVTTPFTVNPSPAPITGPNNVCIGNTINLADAILGGTWTTSCGNASVNPISGVVTGLAAGPCNSITYTLAGGCSVTYPITVNPLPCTNAVIGPKAIAGNIELYPNPAFHELTLKLDDLVFNSFTITNDLGQVVLSKVITDKETTINISKMPPALYYITLKGEQDIVVKRFVKE